MGDFFYRSQNFAASAKSRDRCRDAQRLTFNTSCLIDREADDYSGYKGSPEDAGLWTPQLYEENLVAPEKVLSSAWWLRGDGQV